MMQKKFIAARWEKLLIANYTCDPHILEPFLPAGTETDLFNDTCLVSLVAFQFLDTRVLGIRFPWHTNFVEVNLRFYVKRYDNGKWKRGVVFIKEIVPRVMISFIANTFFNEHYDTMKTGFAIAEKNAHSSLQYYWGKNNFFSCKAGNSAMPFSAGSLEEFITEHYWGYAQINTQSSMEYGVEHPQWKLFPVKEYSVQCHFRQLYGDSFAFLDDAAPHSVLLAEGSDVIVRRGIEIHP